MRITNNMLSQNLLRNLEAAQGRMDELQNQMSSGHRITKPSDDPVGIENVLRLKSGISAVEQWKSNADEALAYMNTTEGVMGDLTNLLQRARELAVQGASDTLPPDSRVALKKEVDQIIDEIRSLANTQVGNRYIFAGTATDKMPLPQSLPQPLPSGPLADWQGNDGSVEFAVGSHVSLSVGLNGKLVFQTTSANGLFQTLSKLSQALANNSSPDINATLTDIDANLDNVLAQRADLGARINRMTSISAQLDSTSVNLRQNLSSIEDADMAKTIVDFQNQQNVYRAALSVGANIIQPSLVDFMR